MLSKQVGVWIWLTGDFPLGTGSKGHIGACQPHGGDVSGEYEMHLCRLETVDRSIGICQGTDFSNRSVYEFSMDHRISKNAGNPKARSLFMWQFLHQEVWKLRRRSSELTILQYRQMYFQTLLIKHILFKDVLAVSSAHSFSYIGETTMWHWAA